MSFLGIKFIPLHIPFQRRVQVLTIYFAWLFCVLFGLGGNIIFIYLFLTEYYFIPVIYYTWMYYDWNIHQEGGRRIKWLQELSFWRIFASYFPAKLVKTADLDPNRNYICGFHPHGIFVFGGVMSFGSEGTGFRSLFPGIKSHLLTLNQQFLMPIYRDVILGIGACSVSKESIDWLLTKEGVGNALVIVPGGAAEALDARPGEATLNIKRRKGFVRMAMKHGVPLVPIYSFGENDVFRPAKNPRGSLVRQFQEYMTRLIGFFPPPFTGRGLFNYSLGYLPLRRRIVTVVGKPMEVTKNENPSVEEVERIHNEYLSNLKELYDDHRGEYGDRYKELVFA